MQSRNRAAGMPQERLYLHHSRVVESPELMIELARKAGSYLVAKIPERLHLIPSQNQLARCWLYFIGKSSELVLREERKPQALFTDGPGFVALDSALSANMSVSP